MIQQACHAIILNISNNLLSYSIEKRKRFEFNTHMKRLFLVAGQSYKPKFSKLGTEKTE